MINEFGLKHKLIFASYFFLHKRLVEEGKWAK